MARDDYSKIVQEWRAGVVQRLENLDDKMQDATQQLNEKLDAARREITDLRMAGITCANLELLEKRVKELEDFKTRFAQTIVVLQVVLFGLWAFVSKLIWK